VRLPTVRIVRSEAPGVARQSPRMGAPSSNSPATSGGISTDSKGAGEQREPSYPQQRTDR